MPTRRRDEGGEEDHTRDCEIASGGRIGGQSWRLRAGGQWPGIEASGGRLTAE